MGSHRSEGFHAWLFPIRIGFFDAEEGNADEICSELVLDSSVLFNNKL